MHPASTDRPTQAQLVFPLLETIAELGGRARPHDVGMALAERFCLPGDVLEETVLDSRGRETNVWQRHVRYAREKAKRMGYVASDEYGVWRLTDEGQEGTPKAEPRVVVTVYADREGRPLHAQIELDMAVPTIHTLRHGDARDLSWIDSRSTQLVVTSPPYHDLKDYQGGGAAQLGDLADYRAFLDNLDEVWRECFRILVPGGQMVVNVGDVLRSRKAHGRHHILPLHADIIVRSREIGFDYLNSPYWMKIGNVAREQPGTGGFLGQPNQPNGVVKLEVEHLIRLKKPGAYRKPSLDQRRLSEIATDEYQRLFRQFWTDLPGASTEKGHPAPFPVELARRLIRMFSFVGDTVCDPFGGRFTTTRASMELGRHSVSTEIVPENVVAGIEMSEHHARQLAA